MKRKSINIVLFALIQFSIPAFSLSTHEESPADKTECGIHDCTLNCLSDGKISSSYGGAKSITTEFLPGGIIRYTLEKGMNGQQTVLVGPNSYICSITKN